MSATQSALLSSLSSPGGGEGAQPSGEPAGGPEVDAGGEAGAGEGGGEGQSEGGEADAQPSQAAAAQPQPTEQQKAADILRNQQAALREARQEIKTLRQELESRPSLTPAQQAALAKLVAADTEPVADPQPDFLQDPKGYVDKGLEQVNAALKKLDALTTETKKKTQEQEQQAQERQKLFADTQAAEAEFVATQPDYPQALAHVRTVRVAQLKETFPKATDQQILNHMAFEEMQAAKSCVEQGINPADYAYRIAKTLGYKPQAPAPASKTNGAGKTVDKDAVRSTGSRGSAEDPPEEGNGKSKMPAEFGAALSERFKRKKN